MMEILGNLGDGILVSLQPLNLLLILIGVTLGLFIGAMPGLGSVNGVAILLPITFLVPPGSASVQAGGTVLGITQARARRCTGNVSTKASTNRCRRVAP